MRLNSKNYFSMKDLITRNYASIVKRGYITPATTGFRFLMKLVEEVNEVNEEEFLMRNNQPHKLGEELADVILTALNFAHHFDINIEKELHKKIEKNEKRKD